MKRLIILQNYEVVEKKIERKNSDKIRADSCTVSKIFSELSGISLTVEHLVKLYRLRV